MPRINQAGKNAEKPTPKTEAAQQPAAPANDAAAAGTETQVTSTESTGDADSPEPDSEPDQDPETSIADSIDNSDQPTQPDADEVAELEPNQVDASPDLTITDRETTDPEVSFQEFLATTTEQAKAKLGISDEEFKLSEEDLAKIAEQKVLILPTMTDLQTADLPSAETVPASLSGASPQPKSRRSFTFETEEGPVTVPLDRLPVHCVPVKWALRAKEELTICESSNGVDLQEDADAINRNFVQPE